VNQTIDEPIELVPASRAQLRSARRLLQRRERGQRSEFLAEGAQAVREALARPGTVSQLLLTAAAATSHPNLVHLARTTGVPSATVGAEDLHTVSNTVTPQGLVAVCRQQPARLADVLAGQPRLLVGCAQVRDPGNAGTVIRCADAFAADAVALTADSVDVYNPKTVRASAGSLFHLPLVPGVDLASLVADCRRAGLQVLAADGSGDVELPVLSGRGALTRPTLWLLGNEAWGLPEEQLALADQVVRVPIYGAAESLNLSTAAAVCLYASATAQRAVPVHEANGLAPEVPAFLD
jgi:TrmH family RNA methyltransferase